MVMQWQLLQQRHYKEMGKGFSDGTSTADTLSVGLQKLHQVQ